MTDLLSETRAARTALLAEFENYLVRQRGLSSRTIYHTLRFANRFLDHRFGEATMDLPDLRPADVIGFIEHVLATARRDKTVATHVRIFLQYLGKLKPAELDREKLIAFGKERARDGAGSVTLSIDLGYIKTILSHAAQGK